MPKSKEFLSSSESSDGSISSDEKRKKKRKREDKKEKAEASKKSKSSNASADTGDLTWDLGNLKQITVRDFKGKTYVDIRTMYMDKNTSELKPTKKGISLNLEQWRKLVDSMDEVDKALKNKC